MTHPRSLPSPTLRAVATLPTLAAPAPGPALFHELRRRPIGPLRSGTELSPAGRVEPQQLVRRHEPARA